MCATIIKQYTTITAKLGDGKGSEFCFDTSSSTMTPKLYTTLHFSLVNSTVYLIKQFTNAGCV